MKAGRVAAGAAVRAMRSDVLNHQDEFINSPEFRAKHKTNKVVKRAFDDLLALREKYKVNPDGSPMTIEDEIAARRAAGLELTDRQRKAAGLLTKAEEKALAADIAAEDDQDESKAA